LSGKSTLSNVLCNTDDFRENGCTINGTENLQKKDFERNGTNYHVIETRVGSLEKKAIYNKIIELMPEGISQVLFVIDKSFTTGEKIMIELYKEIIFETDILKYVTIVGNKFDNFGNKNEYKGDRKYVFEENEIITEIVNSCNGIIHVGYPPVSEGQAIVCQNAMKESRTILLNYLEEKVCQEKYYRLEKDDLHSKISSYTESDKNLYKKIDQQWFNEKCSKEKIIDITGNRCLDFTDTLKIEDFKILEVISLKKLQLTSLEISNCSQLNKIDLSGLTKLQNLSVTECSNLTTLDCLSTELTSLKISSCFQLNEVDLSKLTKLEFVSITGCLALIMLDFCSLTELTSLEINNCSQLDKVDLLKSTKLISLLVTECSNLSILDCLSTELISLKISDCSHLNRVDLLKSTKLEVLSVTECPNLTTLDCKAPHKPARAGLIRATFEPSRAEPGSVRLKPAREPDL
jgi:hypothetical protein